MSILLDTCLEPLTQVDGGLICPRRQQVFTHSPIQQISYNGDRTKTFNEIGPSIMAFDYNCTEQLIVFSSTWHKIVDVETGRKIREIYDQDGFVSAVSFSKTNPNVFASTGTDSSIRTWDIRAHPAQTLHLRRQRRYRSIVYSPDSNFLAFAGEAVNLVDLSNPRNISQINCPSPVLSVRFNPVEYLLATASDDRVVRFWDIDTEECVSQSLPFESIVKNVEFDAQGKCLIASCASTISAFHWEPFECVGQLDLCSLKSRNLSGSNSVPNSNGSSTNRLNMAFKSLDLRTIDDKILHLGFDESTHRLFLQSTTISELCSVSPTLPVQSLDFGSNAIGSFSVDSPTPQHWDSNSNHSLGSPFDETPDSAIGNTVRSFVEVAARERHQSNSEGFGQSPKAMTGSCCISMGPMTTSKLPGSLLPSANGHPTRPQNLTASHSESRIQKPTRARSNVRLNATKEAKGSNIGPNHRAPSVEAALDGHQRSGVRASSIHAKQTPTRQPVTPVEDRTFANLSLKRNGSVPNESAAEKHASVMDMLSSRLRDCRRINSLLKTKNGEDEALDEATKMNDGLHIFAQFLRAYKQNPTAYNLQVSARLIPTLRRMLVHKNSTYVDLALDTLANILNEFTEPIKHALAPNVVSIGVDLAAEQRHMHCTNCKQALTELYLNSSFILEKLTPPQRDYFNMLIPKIEQISEL